jgi:ADP-ribose pyrophosphatase YjhB (NUDIX family)
MENTGDRFQQPDSKKLVEYYKRIKALAQTGLVYSEDDYNRDRYSEISEISNLLLEEISGIPAEVIRNFYLNTGEYPTPKTDIRAVIFNQHNEILLVKEASDQKWSLPGGWADIGYTPAEVVVKEVEEETGLIVTPVKLLAVLDKKNYPHPPQLEYVYKHFIQCTITGGAIRQAHDISEVAFFPQQHIPALSEIRIVQSQVDMMFEFLYNADKPTIFE